MIVKYSKQQTAVAGSISFNSDDLRGICYRIYVSPATSTTTYDVTITDDNSAVIYSKKGLRGTLNDLSTQTLKGIHTIAVNNASVNEQFTFQIEYQEDP